MRKLLFLALAVFALLSCSKDEEKEFQTITNLSGVDWHNTEVFFKKTPEEFLPSTYSNVGTVLNGKDCRVSSGDPIFYIYAKDAQGNRIVSKDLTLTKTVVVKPEDLLEAEQ